MKPDWATRLQRTFARKYDAGFAKGLMLGKAVATRDEQERIIKLLEKWQCMEDFCSCWTDNQLCENRDELIALIKGKK